MANWKIILVLTLIVLLTVAEGKQEGSKKKKSKGAKPKQPNGKAGIMAKRQKLRKGMTLIYSKFIIHSKMLTYIILGRNLNFTIFTTTVNTKRDIIAVKFIL